MTDLLIRVDHLHNTGVLAHGALLIGMTATGVSGGVRIP